MLFIYKKAQCRSMNVKKVTCWKNAYVHVLLLISEYMKAVICVANSEAGHENFKNSHTKCEEALTQEKGFHSIFSD